MISFNNLIIHNFGSYGHAEIDLKNKGFCQVLGENNCIKDNAKSNGAGKSLWSSAICFVLTGETISGQTKNLKNINIEEDPDCYVTLNFTNGADHYEITRVVAPKSNLRILKNSENVGGAGIRDSEKHLKELLPDITKDLIGSIIILGQGMPTKFSSFSPSGRKELLEKLTKSDFMIEDIKNRVAERSKILASQVRELEDLILVSSSKQEQYTRLIPQYKAKLETEKETNYAEILAKKEAEYTELSAQIAEAEKLVVDLENQNKAINSELLNESAHKSELTQQLYTEQFKMSQSITDDKSNLENQIYQYKSKIQSLDSTILRVKSMKDTCPTCGQKLAGVVIPSTEKEESEKAELNEKVKLLNESLQNVKTKIANLNTEYSAKSLELTKPIDLKIQSLNSKSLDLQTKINSIQDKELRVKKNLVQSLQAEIIKYQAAQATQENIINNLVAEIAAYEKESEDLTASIKEKIAQKEVLVAHQGVVKKMETLIKRDFRGYLLTNIINYIDKKAKDYSENIFKTRELNVYLDGNNLGISYCGKEIESLSGGERTRVDLILQFAIRNMLQVYLNMSSNILILDEVTDFLDKKSCDAIMSFIEQELNDVESVFIISHHSEELGIAYDTSMKIIKNENGISEVYQ